MPASIYIDGMEEAKVHLGQLESIASLREPMEQSVTLVMGKMKRYPPVRPGQLYKRTRTLGKRWTTQVRSVHNGLEGVVGNNTTYGPWVQSSRFQAMVHRNRWQTDEMVLSSSREQIVGYFEKAIRRLLGR